MVAICENLNEAFQVASDLWVIPEKGRWASHLDWYLNWQICKGLAHSPAVPAQDLVDFVKQQELEIDLSTPRPESKPLLICAENLLPTALCLVRTEQESAAAEMSAIREYASSLKASRVMVFVSAGSNPVKLADAWEKLSSEIEMRLAPEDLL